MLHNRTVPCAAAILFVAGLIGWYDWQEHVADTIPTNAASYFDPQFEGDTNGWRFLVPDSSVQRLYDVQWCTNLRHCSWMRLDLAIPGNNGILKLAVTNDAARRRCFYRPAVRMP